MAKVAVIIVAAGDSTRCGLDVKKQYASIQGKASWLRSAEVFRQRADVISITLVISTDDERYVLDQYGNVIKQMDIHLAHGGATRTASVRNGLATTSSDANYVAVHDAARPCITDKYIDKLFTEALRYDAIVPATKVADSLKTVDADGNMVNTVKKQMLWLVQTPQVIKRSILTEAYSCLGSDASFEDEAALLHSVGKHVHILEMTSDNIKITHKSDIDIAEAIIAHRR